MVATPAPHRRHDPAACIAVSAPVAIDCGSHAHLVLAMLGDPAGFEATLPLGRFRLRPRSPLGLHEHGPALEPWHAVAVLRAWFDRRESDNAPLRWQVAKLRQDIDGRPPDGADGPGLFVWATIAAQEGRLSVVPLDGPTAERARDVEVRENERRDAAAKAAQLARLDALRAHTAAAFPGVASAAAAGQPARRNPPQEPMTSWIEVVLVDEAGAAVGDLAYVLTTPGGGERSGRLRADGRLRLDDLRPGEARFRLPGLDHRLWRAAEGTAATAQTPVPAGGATRHRVRAGEGIDAIAAAHGMPADVLWDDPGNQELRRRRPHRNVLAAGDEVAVPRRERGEFAIATDRSHRFVVLGRSTTVGLRLAWGEVPRKDQAWALHLAGKKRGEGRSDAAGMVEARVPVDAAQAEIAIGEEGTRLALALDALMPVEEEAGVVARLAGLGFLVRAQLPLTAEANRAAVCAFRRRFGLADGETLDDDARRALVARHGGSDAWPADVFAEDQA